MNDDISVVELLTRWRAGDDQAAEHIFARYAHRLHRLAEQNLSRKLASRMDGEDVVQSVFRTFFRRTAAGQFVINSSDQLWSLLARITVYKARNQGRRHNADRRSVAAEVPGVSAHAVGTLARDPSPEEEAALADQIDMLLKGLPDLHGEVLDMRLQGFDVVAIADKLQVSRQTVYRALHLLQNRLNRSAADLEQEI